MRPTTALNDNVIDLTALFHPGTVLEHPRDVVSHPTLSISDKPAILASWASDASAIASCSLRAPERLKAPVMIDEILEALCALDEGPQNPPGGSRCAWSRSNVPQPGMRTMNDIRFPAGGDTDERPLGERTAEAGQEAAARQADRRAGGAITLRARDDRERARSLPPGKEREDLLRRARRTEEAARMTGWFTTPSSKRKT